MKSIFIFFTLSLSIPAFTLPASLAEKFQCPLKINSSDNAFGKQFALALDNLHESVKGYCKDTDESGAYVSEIGKMVAAGKQVATQELTDDVKATKTLELQQGLNKLLGNANSGVVCNKNVEDGDSISNWINENSGLIMGGSLALGSVLVPQLAAGALATSALRMVPLLGGASVSVITNLDRWLNGNDYKMGEIQNYEAFTSVLCTYYTLKTFKAELYKQKKIYEGNNGELAGYTNKIAALERTNANLDSQITKLDQTLDFLHNKLPGTVTQNARFDELKRFHKSLREAEFHAENAEVLSNLALAIKLPPKRTVETPVSSEVDEWDAGGLDSLFCKSVHAIQTKFDARIEEDLETDNSMFKEYGISNFLEYLESLNGYVSQSGLNLDQFRQESTTYGDFIEAISEVSEEEMDRLSTSKQRNYELLTQTIPRMLDFFNSGVVFMPLNDGLSLDTLDWTTCRRTLGALHNMFDPGKNALALNIREELTNILAFLKEKSAPSKSAGENDQSPTPEETQPLLTYNLSDINSKRIERRMKELESLRTLYKNIYKTNQETIESLDAQQTFLTSLFKTQDFNGFSLKSLEDRITSFEKSMFHSGDNPTLAWIKSSEASYEKYHQKLSDQLGRGYVVHANLLGNDLDPRPLILDQDGNVKSSLYRILEDNVDVGFGANLSFAGSKGKELQKNLCDAAVSTTHSLELLIENAQFPKEFCKSFLPLISVPGESIELEKKCASIVPVQASKMQARLIENRELIEIFREEELSLRHDARNFKFVGSDLNNAGQKIRDLVALQEELAAKNTELERDIKQNIHSFGETKSFKKFNAFSSLKTKFENFFVNDCNVM